jgi:hypothetical protein
MKFYRQLFLINTIVITIALASFIFLIRDVLNYIYILGIVAIAGLWWIVYIKLLKPNKTRFIISYVLVNIFYLPLLAYLVLGAILGKDAEPIKVLFGTAISLVFLLPLGFCSFAGLSIIKNKFMV